VAGAAQAAGISPRTYRDWKERAEGRHPTREATEELVQLFEEIGQARALFRVRMEIEIGRTDPKHWLKYNARTTAEEPGWTDPPVEPPSPAEPAASPPTHVCHDMATAEEAEAVMQILWDAGAIGFEDDDEEEEEEEDDA